MAGPTAFQPDAFQVNAFQIVGVSGTCSVDFDFDVTADGTATGEAVRTRKGRGGGTGAAPRRIDESWRRRRQKPVEEPKKPRRKPERERIAARGRIVAISGTFDVAAVASTTLLGSCTIATASEVSAVGWAEDENWLLDLVA